MYFTKIEEMEFKLYELEVVVERSICEAENEPEEIVNALISLCLTSIREEIKCKSDELRKFVENKPFKCGIAIDFISLVDLSSDEILKNILKRIVKALEKSGHLWLRIVISHKSGIISSKFSCVSCRG